MYNPEYDILYIFSSIHVYSFLLNAWIWTYTIIVEGDTILVEGDGL